jgi:hypothetical protein
MDAQEQLVWDSEISMAVVGKGGDFVLIDLGEVDDDVTKLALARGYAWCGVLGVKDGQPCANCEPNPDAALTMMHAALAFAQKVADRLRPPQKGDAVEWLESLYRLPDPRD